jgi:hypothetical protein
MRTHFVLRHRRPKEQYHLGEWVRRYAERTGLSPNGKRMWLRWEIDVLKRLYPRYDLILASLPHRTQRAVHRKSNVLGLPRKSGRTNRRYNKVQLSVLRVIFTSLDAQQLQATCASMGLTLKKLHLMAARRGWRRWRKPYAPTGLLPLDNLRRRCFANAITMVEIDEWTDGNGYFTGRWRDRPIALKLIDKAHKVLDDWEQR